MTGHCPHYGEPVILVPNRLLTERVSELETKLEAKEERIAELEAELNCFDAR